MNERLDEAPRSPSNIGRCPGPPPARLLSYRVANLQGVGSREHQEDSFTLVNAMDVTELRRRGLLAVVADGMGGMRGGKQASEAAIASLKADFQAMDRTGDLAGALRRSVLRAGKKVCSLLGGSGGSTAIVCLLFQQRLWYAGVGDSSLFLLRDGELLTVNREQNVQTDRFLETLRAGSLDPSAGREDPERAALTGFLGMEDLEDVDYLRRPLKLREGDTLLLCSDGVAGVLPEAELKRCLLLSTPEESCAALERSVMLANNPYQDNFTALVIRCGY